MKREIKTEIIAGSLNEHGQKITTWVGTMPRMIWAEFLTHRCFSRNAASSRAIPALKMIANIESDPFIPVAWQKEHKGMQGTEYIEDKQEIYGVECGWNDAMKDAVRNAKNLMLDPCVTKQLTNRLLEPFQWYTAIFTTTETENFFNLRCPQYTFPSGQMDDYVYKSRKDFLRFVPLPMEASDYDDWTDLDWLKVNKGQGEIHISLLAEAMWDSMNEYDYKQLKAGEWHIPFGNKIDHSRVDDLIEDYARDRGEHYDEIHTEHLIKIATARCARVSYNNFEGKDDYEADIKLYDILKASGHFSPFEHCARAMSEDEMSQWCRYVPQRKDGKNLKYLHEVQEGWSNNFRGFVQLRAEL